jgi:cytidine deaminase
MKKLEISPADETLVAAAAEAVKAMVHQPCGVKKAPALVGAAVRLNDGSIITSVNLIADVGGLSVCAEPIAIAQAVRHPDKRIEAVVAVYYAVGQEPCVVSPCGRCREAITDYAPDASVILRSPGEKSLFKVKAPDLLPLKYAEYWRGDTLI